MSEPTPRTTNVSRTPLPEGLRALLEARTDACLALTPDFEIVAVSDAYLEAIGAKREEILGRVLFDLFADGPARRGLEDSLGRVLRRRISDAMGIQQFDLPGSQRGAHRERYWRGMSSPVFGPGGEIACILHEIEDMTGMVRLRDPSEPREPGPDRPSQAVGGPAHSPMTGVTTRRRVDRDQNMEDGSFARARDLREDNERLREANARHVEELRELRKALGEAEEKVRVSDALLRALEENRESAPAPDPASENQATGPNGNGTPPSGGPPRRRVLVVNGDRDTSESLATVLGTMGHEVHVAHDGPRALQAARTHRPDTVLLDLGMPGMSGREIARRLRQELHMQGLLVAMTTGSEPEENGECPDEVGFDHQLVKPIEQHALEALLLAPHQPPEGRPSP